MRSFAPKDPQEVDFWEIDFSDVMPSDDSVTSVLTSFVSGSDAALTVDNIGFAGKSVSGRWQGGTLDVTYTITARVTTAQGRTLDKSGLVLIAEL